MNYPYYIRELYRPVQPAIKSCQNKVIYQEIEPAPAVQPFIYCYWKLQSTEVLNEDFYYRVVADGCIDVFFEWRKPDESYVMGFCKKYTAFSIGNDFHYVGIRFLPTMFPQLFGIDASTLSNNALLLNTVVPDLSAFIKDNFSVSADRDLIKTYFDRYFDKCVQAMNFSYDSRLYDALEHILKNNGVVQVEKELTTAISARHLRRLFMFYIGDTAKTFCQVVRFQQMLREKSPNTYRQKNKLFFDDSYYDQAHFIKEFKTFYGTNPSEAITR